MRPHPSIADRLYGALSWLAFLAVSLPLVAVLCVLPGEDRRRRAARLAARTWVTLSGCSLAVRGLENLPPDSCIVAANHASYLDGLLLTAVLPPRFAFVIKREMTQVPVAHFLLRRIGSQFVERFDTRRGATDARRVLALAEARQCLAFFPEGTFHAEPGLRRFQNGAFAAAVRGNVPVVPVAIIGTRDMLPADAWLPRRRPLVVIVKPAVRHNGEHDAVAALRKACRSSILMDLGEPDLT
ncbi:MAG: 1-acyl-sn-glycerol-3-phosphate acyltransferase [Gammaproteobacteria bacterium]|nr:1-acyl-sn-glycerol-3-phosphate acyltransferase [Gammaproteobacteria bacterium]